MAAIEAASRIVVCDAGPPIHLHELGCLSLLSDFSRVLVPASVWDEIAEHRPAALNQPNLTFERRDPRTALGVDLASVAQVFTLHRGELDALHLTQELQADLFLTDDAAARLAARQLSLPVHGTIGIVVRAIRRGQRTKDEVIAILRSLSAVSTLHIRRSLLEEIIEQIEGPK